MTRGPGAADDVVSPWTLRTDVQLTPDSRRVVARLFLPGQENIAPGVSRAAGVLDRCLAFDEPTVRQLLDDVMARHAGRHRSLEEILDEHFEAVAHRISEAGRLSPQRRRLIGAYFTQEYALEAAALFNPSVVAHPIQDVPTGDLRFVMSARAVGEGHLSSVVFRTGTITASRGSTPSVTVDVSSPNAGTGSRRTAYVDADRLRKQTDLAGTDAESLDFVLAQLPARFTPEQLEWALDRLHEQKLTRADAMETAQRLRRSADSWYELEFDPAGELSERALMPQLPVESRGVEDARFVRFTDDDGTATYLATYTAFDGDNICVRRLQTDDFRVFRSSPFSGKASTDKGMALFPRRVQGRYAALSRWDRENTAVAFSNDGYDWPQATRVQIPQQPWELIQLGNCGSPIETREGWLVLTHGVGPMRRYSVGALLLDLDDPSRVIGRLRRPLLTPADDERDGYVPNVVYSCGALLHDRTLMLPYGCSDSRIRIALLDLPAVVDSLSHGSDRERSGP